MRRDRGRVARRLPRRRPAPRRRFATVREAVAACGPLPAGSRVTFEPGGQVELSTTPLPELAGVRARSPTTPPRSARRWPAAGIGLVGLGLEPGPPRDRAAPLAPLRRDGGVLRRRRRRRAHDDAQHRRDPGERRPRARRRRRAPLAPAHTTSVRCSRPRSRTHRSRTARRAVGGRRGSRCGARSTPAARRPVDATRRRAAASGVGALRARRRRHARARPTTSDHVPVLDRLTFADWIDHGHELGWPTLDDLEYHLTTLFPPVRPRGWLELRMIDARAVAVVARGRGGHRRARSTTTTPPTRAACAVEPVRDRWVEAARYALAIPTSPHAARECFAAALDALPAAGRRRRHRRRDRGVRRPLRRARPMSGRRPARRVGRDRAAPARSPTTPSRRADDDHALDRRGPSRTRAAAAASTSLDAVRRRRSAAGRCRR